MLPKVYPLLYISDLIPLIGDRIYRHGDAPEGVQTPYVTWFVVSGVPENALDDLPLVDSYTVQVDVWSDDDAEVEQVAKAVRDAIEPFHVMTGMTGNSQDDTTMRYRISMTFGFWTDRE